MKPLRLAILLIFSFTASFTYVNANVIILNGLTHVHKGEKGNQIKGEILLQNLNKTEAQRITINLKDLLQHCDGQIEYLDINSHIRSLGDWISFNTNEKVLSPNEEFAITYVIDVPENIDIDDVDYGSFWTTIMIDIEKPINEDNQYGVQISSKIRYGVQIVASIGELVDPELEFADVSVSKIDFKADADAETETETETDTETEADAEAKPDVYNVDIMVQNNGLFMVQPVLILELFNAEGESVKKVEALFKKVYPKNCKGFNIELVDVPEGEYDAVLIADYGGDIFGANLTLTIGQD